MAKWTANLLRYRLSAERAQLEGLGSTLLVFLAISLLVPEKLTQNDDVDDYENKSIGDFRCVVVYL